MNARPEKVPPKRDAGSLYARVFDIAWRHAERMTHLTEIAGMPWDDCHGEDLAGSAPELPELTGRKTPGRPVPAA